MIPEWTPTSEIGKGLKTGVKGAAQMAVAIGTIPVAAADKTNIELLDLYERADDLPRELTPPQLAQALGIDLTDSHQRIMLTLAQQYHQADDAERDAAMHDAGMALSSNRELLAGMVETIKAYSAEMEKTQGRVPNFTDIGDVKDFADWFMFNSGQALPYLAVTALAGAAAGPAGVGASGYAMGVGDIQAGLVEQGITDGGEAALLGAVPYAALEYLGPAARYFRPSKKVLGEVATSYFKRLGREVPANAVEEFINEAGQEIIKDYAMAAGGGEPVVVDDQKLLAWFNSGMAGVAGGAPMGAVTAIPGEGGGEAPAAAKPPPRKPGESEKPEEPASEQQPVAAGDEAKPATAPPATSPEDELLAAMGAAPETPAQNVRNAQNVQPEPDRSQTGAEKLPPNVEIIDEVDTDPETGESVQTGRKIRWDKANNTFTPVEDGATAAPSEADAVPPQTPEGDTAAGAVDQQQAATESSISTATLNSEDVAKITTDAKTFQYKDNGNAQGITERLEGVERWDERSATGGIVYEYADGRRVVADGHQRIGLAKRLQAQGQKTPWTVEIIRETDGFTPADVRRIAALKNIREGSGTAIDAAKVLREAPEDGAALDLPPKSALVRDARGLANLSDEAFGAVVNEVVSPAYGAMVGRLVKNKDAHSGIIRLLAKLKPSNQRQAEMIVEQAAAATVTEKQEDLFGERDVAENLYLERAKVLDNALTRLKEDKKTFKMLGDRAAAITAEGNVLNSKANARRLETVDEMQAYLQAEANRKGPISDALTAAARQYRAEPKQGYRIVRDFLDRIARTDAEGVRRDREAPDRQGSRQQGDDAQQEVGAIQRPEGRGGRDFSLLTIPERQALNREFSGAQGRWDAAPEQERIRIIEAAGWDEDAAAEGRDIAKQPWSKIDGKTRSAIIKAADRLGAAPEERQKQPQNIQRNIPTTEPGAEGKPQTVIPGTREDQGRDTSRAKAEMDARAKQSRMGTTKPQANAGPLFGDEGGTQGDMFAPPAAGPAKVTKEQRALNMFYSPLLRALDAAKQKRAPAQDWKAIIGKLPGVKKAEVEWLGVNDWLDAQEGQVAKEDIVAFVRESQIEVVEDTLAGTEGAEPTFFVGEDGTAAYVGEEAGGDVVAEGEFDPEARTYTFPDLGVTDGTQIDVLNAARRQWEQGAGAMTGFDGAARFEGYTEDGGANYREILIRVPNLHTTGGNNTFSGRAKALWSKMDQIAPYDEATGRRDKTGLTPEQVEKLDDLRTQFSEQMRADRKEGRGNSKDPFVQSSHFEQENIVVHARVKDRTGPNGEKVLFVEEIQSDLASKWRENSESQEVTARRRELKLERERLRADNIDLGAQLVGWLADNGHRLASSIGGNGIGGALGDQVRAISEIALGRRQPRLAASETADLAGKLTDSAEMLDVARAFVDGRDAFAQVERDLIALGTERTVDPSLPDTPFREEATYTLMVKRLLRLAAEGGYDRLSWTPGYMQAERWNAAGRSVVKDIEWAQGPENTAADGSVSTNTEVVLGLANGSTLEFEIDKTGLITNAFSGPVEMRQSIEGKNLSDLVGPSVAREIRQAQEGTISGQKITFPDSGYAIAYDQQTRKAVNALAKRSGASVYEDRTLPDFYRKSGRSLDEDAKRLGLTEKEAFDRLRAAGINPDKTVEDQIAIETSWGRATAPDRDVAATIIMLRSADREGKASLVAPEIIDPVWSIDITPDLRASAMEPMALLRKDDERLRSGTPQANWLHDIVMPLMPALRRELDRLNLKRVNLYIDDNAARAKDGVQGMFNAYWNGRMDILIGQSMDPKATLHHEAIHALRHMNLFTPAEWRALEIKAARSWVEKYDIAKRYPDALPSEQIEEAIAEAFADWAKGQYQPVGHLATAFEKIRRFFAAIRNMMKGAGFQSAEDVFGKTFSGEVGGRPPMSIEDRIAAIAASKRQAAPAQNQNQQQQANAATQMMGSSAHIPSRGIWDELWRNNTGVWNRIRGGAAAAHDHVDTARIFLQDRFLPVLRAQEAVIRETGRAIPEDQNAYRAEETFSGKVGRHLFEIDEDYTKPIIDLMVGESGQERLDDGYVGKWLYARHAVERNERIAAINPNKPDGGSGMMTDEARQILAEARSGPNFERLKEIGKLIDNLRERTLALRVDAGLMTEDEAQVWRDQYKAYVPLKGFADTENSDAMLDIGGVGRRFNVRGAESRMALGRGSEAFSPLQAAITQAQEVAIRAEKNRVGNALYNLAKENEAPALWKVKTPKVKQYFNRSTGLVETRVEDPRSLILEPNEMAVKVDGKEKRIVFKDVRLAEAAGAVGADRMNWFISVMSKAARIFSAVNTMLDPEFVVRNAIRDMQAAQINIRNFGEGDRNAIAKAMLKNWPKAFLGVYRGQANKADTDWTRYYREFEQAGAKVSFWKLDQPTAARDDFRKRVRMATPGTLSHASRWVRFSTRDNPVLGFIERTNLAVDNAVRLAAFVAARQAGWSASEAASLSKNLTVNFNRRGEWGATINALYPFANAGLQGTQVMFRAFTSKRMAKYAVGMIGMGLILDLVNAWMSHEDDDGELAYDKIPDWKNRTNLAVMLGPDAENAASIWMPYGYSLFPYLGQQAGKIIRGVKKPEDALKDFAAAAMGAFSPIGGFNFEGNAVRDLQEMVTPTMLDPINEMAMNEDWLGRPIRPENPWQDYGPAAYKYYGGVSDISKAISDAANRATGGDIARSGAVDISPEYLDHAFSFVFGGAGRFAGRIGDTFGKLVTGRADEIEDNDIPFYRSVKTETGEWLDRDRFYRFKNEVKAAREAAKTYSQTGHTVPADVRQLTALYGALSAAEKALKASSARKKKVIANRSLTFSQRQNAIRAIEQANSSVYLRFNKAFLKRMGPQGE